MFPPARGRRRVCPIMGIPLHCFLWPRPERSPAPRFFAARSGRSAGRGQRKSSEGGLWFRLLWLEKMLEVDVPVRWFRDKLKLSTVREHVQLDDLGQSLVDPDPPFLMGLLILTPEL